MSMEIIFTAIPRGCFTGKDLTTAFSWTKTRSTVPGTANLRLRNGNGIAGIVNSERLEARSEQPDHVKRDLAVIFILFYEGGAVSFSLLASRFSLIYIPES
jgi:hypothetical protein